jgi:DNA-binding MarR family transcriptional regulator
LDASGKQAPTWVSLRFLRIFFGDLCGQAFGIRRRSKISNRKGRQEDPQEHKEAAAAIYNIRYNEYIGSVAKSIQSEIQQTKPFSILEEEALVTLQRTADRLHWRMSEMLKAHGLSPTQYNALRILRGAGEEGRSCSEIAERMINRDPDITRLVDRLERRGLAARSREGHDRRVIITRITPGGLKLLESLDRPVEDLNRKLLGPIGEQRLRTLIQLLDAVREQSD